VRDRVKVASRLLAEIKGPKADVEQAVQQIAGVRSVGTTLVDGWNHLRIESQPGTDVRAQISDVVGKRGWSLRELRLEVGSLEEFFIQITAEAARPRFKKHSDGGRAPRDGYGDQGNQWVGPLGQQHIGTPEMSSEPRAKQLSPDAGGSGQHVPLGPGEVSPGGNFSALCAITQRELSSLFYSPWRTWSASCFCC